ncbi:MAG: VRR-NUC domain-containing protein [Puniceicoccales bacterium]|jgi:hypothetical protein|nr:VRR-NUC domain-containing protein [Puniceicoccales bacterium]
MEKLKYLSARRPETLNWTETQHQEELFRWAKGEIEGGRTSLENLGTIPNGCRQVRWAAIGKRHWLGVRPGMPDVYFLVPRDGYHGLFVELKSLKASAKVTLNQDECHERLRKNGYRVEVCYGFLDAIKAIDAYDNGSNSRNGRGL